MPKIHETGIKQTKNALFMLMGKNRQFYVRCNYWTTESVFVSCKSVKEISPSRKELPKQQHSLQKSRHAVC